MKSFYAIVVLLLMTLLTGCSSGQGQLNCDLWDSAQYSQYTDVAEKATYSLRCSAQHQQYAGDTPGG